MTHAGWSFMCFRGKPSTHLAYQFMTVKTVSMDKPEINSFFEIRFKENEGSSGLDFHFTQEEGTKAFLEEGMANSEPFHQVLLHFSAQQPSHPAAERQKTSVSSARDRVRKANEPEGDRRCPKFLRFQGSDLHVVECASSSSSI
jgi:hypothetical protein